MNRVRATPRHLALMAAATALAFVVGVVLPARYRLMWDSQPHSCLPYTAYLINLRDRMPSRNDYYAFRTQGLEPHFHDGTLFLKRVAAVPGDRIDETNGVLSINGRPEVVLNASTLGKLHATAANFVRHIVVPAGHYLMLGTATNSYDGRYWGLVGITQIYGRAYPLW